MKHGGRQSHSATDEIIREVDIWLAGWGNGCPYQRTSCRIEKILPGPKVNYLIVMGPNGEVQIWWTIGGTTGTVARPNEHRIEANILAVPNGTDFVPRINQGSSNLGCSTEGWKQTETSEIWKTRDRSQDGALNSTKIYLIEM
jgi:hypothetical protein